MRGIRGEDNRCRKLMIGVLATMIQDYLYAKEITNNIDRECLRLVRYGKKKTGKEARRAGKLTKGALAKSYIFDDSWESDNYVFGFKFICRYIDLDPGRFRKAILKLKMDTIRDVWDRARSH